jgi:hypothetical protein
MPEFDLSETIKNLLAESEAAEFLDGEGEDDDALPEEYRNIMQIMFRQFGAGMVVHQYMAIRFEDGGQARTREEALRMANAFMMGLQMGVRRPDWAAIVVADLDDIEESDRDAAHRGQDALANLLPLE